MQVDLGGAGWIVEQLKRKKEKKQQSLMQY
jgi:hypothetical protein